LRGRQKIVSPQLKDEEEDDEEVQQTEEEEEVRFEAEEKGRDKRKKDHQVCRVAVFSKLLS
jgi:hypothetical protein